MAGKKMSGYTPLENDKKDYFLGAGDGSIVAVGVAVPADGMDNRKVNLNELSENVDWEGATGSDTEIRSKPYFEISPDNQVVPTLIKCGEGINLTYNSDGWVVIDLEQSGS
jgi:hypothetical protein